MLNRSAVWYLDADGLHWLAFTVTADAVHVARRLKVMFGVAAFVAEYNFEAPQHLRQPFYRLRKERATTSGAPC